MIRINYPEKWFESYHWFITSSGNLVVAGKDVNGNEKVVKKHMSEKDIYIHADLYGAPSTILKVEKENTDLEKDILEAAQFAVSNSRAWSNNLASGSAYWVTPLQVSKTPESGEFVRKGSWIVKGKRNYLFNLPLKLKISTVIFENTELPMIFEDFNEGLAFQMGKLKEIDPQISQISLSLLNRIVFGLW